VRAVTAPDMRWERERGEADLSFRRRIEDGMKECRERMFRGECADPKVTTSRRLANSG